MTSKEQLKELVDLFRENTDRYKTMSYDESNTRSDFIDKFFILLGWDVRNDKGYSEDYREVVREDKVRIEGKTKAPDTLDGKGKAKVEEKPETRKAGGVYYTPNYIVDYIVENTVGKLPEGKKPEDISEMTIVDPACANGTKLILQEKKDILIRHIYGVDLDSQAVEVSKLSLLLKLMEDEGAMDSAGLSFTYLPNLENNIKAGNSLVGKDYLDTI